MQLKIDGFLFLIRMWQSPGFYTFKMGLRELETERDLVALTGRT